MGLFKKKKIVTKQQCEGLLSTIIGQAIGMGGLNPGSRQLKQAQNRLDYYTKQFDKYVMRHVPTEQIDKG